MVEYKTPSDYDLDLVFQALADGTRRDILQRAIERDQAISELADKYNMSFAAVAKHVGVLEKAQLVTKQKEGRQQIVSIKKDTITFARQFLERYQKLWNERFDRLETLLLNEKEK